MNIFIREPEYQFGCLGFVTTRSLRRSVIWLGAVLSALTVTIALTLLLVHRTTPALVGQAIFLVISDWLFVFLLFRLFWSGAMWLFDHIGDLFRNAMPELTKPIDYIYLAYWYFFEIFFTLGFLCLFGYALLLPLGIVQPM